MPASELSTTPAEDPLRLPDRVTRRRGLDGAAGNSLQPAVNAITSSTGRRRNLVNYGEDEDDEEEDDEDNEVEANEEESDDEQEEASAEEAAADEDLDEDEASDPDDDKPLGRLMASSESQKSLRHRPTRGGGGDIDNGDVEAGPSSRSARAVKRNYAEEESDDESASATGRRVVHTQTLKRRRLQSQTDHERTPYKGKARGQTRTPNGSGSHYNTRHHAEADDASDLEPNGDDEADAEPQISRYGRVCKISNRVKGYFRE